MADSSDAASQLKLNIKGPSDLKLSVSVSTDQTVRQLKEEIEKQKPDTPADAQRLIYAGKVLKDDEPLSVYKIKDGNTVHMVKSAARSAPTTGNPSVPGTAPSATGSSASNNAAASQSQGVPSNFSAGQNFTNNPLSALNRADYAGPHMARLLNESGGAFGGMGLNPRDPNMMMGLMQNPEVQRQMRDMMSRPEFIDQMIAMNPQLQGMAPQMREMMRSEQFREMITNPETMQRMAQMSQLMEGAGLGGMGGMGGLGGLGGLGASGGGGGFNNGGGQWPPPGAFGNAGDSQNSGSAAGGNSNLNSNNGNGGGLFSGMGNDNSNGRRNGQGNTGMFSGNFNGLGNTGGAESGGQAPPNPFADPSFLQQMFGGGGAGGFGGLGGLGGLGGFGAGAQAPRDSRPPEERFASQLEQMQAMGFYDGQANVRALLMAGGNVEGAIGILLDNPNPPPQGN